MIPYIIHVSVIIAVCFLFYKSLLQKETFFRLNRWVLLACIVVSFSLPVIPVPAKWSFRNTVEQTIQPVIKLQANENVSKNEETVIKDSAGINASPVDQVSEPISWISWLYYLYVAGVVIFAVNLLFQLILLIIQSYTRPFVQDGPFRIIEVSGNRAPCSFGNTIFINPSKYDFETYNQILLHEKIHCSQKHSIDIMLAEMVLVCQWFNPFAWLYRKQVESNLEFLTDDSMINRIGIEPSGYQLNLLKVAVPHLPLGITTNYNQSLLKKRIAMMNEKKSSMRTTWKYFFLLPLLTGLVCALNQPVVLAQSAPSAAAKEKADDNDNGIETEGTWFATIQKDKISFDFKGSKDDRSWSNNTSFLKSEFPALPTQEKGDFKLTRDAGTILFNGKFDGDLGYGHYKFTSDETFRSYLKQQGIDEIKEQDMFAFFMVNVTKAYVNVLQNNGYKDISKDNLIAMAALDVNERYIRFWKTLGYDNPSPNHLISSKALGIDSAYLDDLQKAGYKNMDMDKLTAFKAQGITGDYIKKMKKARADKGETNPPSEDDIITFKAMNIEDSYIKSISEAGYSDVSYQDLVSMKSLGVDAAFIKSFQAIGYKKIATNVLISFKSLGVSAEFIKGFETVGYKNIPEEHIVSLKSLGIKPDFIKGFKSIGFKDISLDDVTAVKSMGITPEYITSMRKKGFDSNDINKYIELKSSFHEVQ